jgi:hypothetical protein
MCREFMPTQAGRDLFYADLVGQYPCRRLNRGTVVKCRHKKYKKQGCSPE